MHDQRGGLIRRLGGAEIAAVAIFIVASGDKTAACGLSHSSDAVIQLRICKAPPLVAAAAFINLQSYVSNSVKTSGALPESSRTFCTDSLLHRSHILAAMFPSGLKCAQLADLPSIEMGKPVIAFNTGPS